ncbi:MAG: choice-of-anchor D domain-containing protein [Verrucomicrobiales bacterium]
MIFGIFSQAQWSAASVQAPGGLSDDDWSSIRTAYQGERHAVRTGEDQTHRAWNPGQGWRTVFDGRGFLIHPRDGDWVWGMTMESVGSRSLVGAQPEEIKAIRNKLSYHWDKHVEEWFINDHRGLEQGWTIGQKLGRGPLLLTFTLRGMLEPTIARDGRSVSFSSDHLHALTYGGLKAWDATGRMLDAHFAHGNGPRGLVVHIDDTGATYPITVDPVAQQAYLKASDVGAGDEFGHSVAIDGDTVVVGAQGEDGDPSSTSSMPNDNSSNAGAAYVFVRSGTTWSQQAYLKASNAQLGDEFGHSVAIDGDTIIVGARLEDGDATSTSASPNDHASNAGAAYVFVRSGTTWSQQAYLKASNPEGGDHLGHSVAIDGDTVVAGARNEDGDGSSTAAAPNENAINAGAAYVFQRNGTDWSQQAYLKAPDASQYNYFGIAVAVDQDTVVAGALTEPGYAYVFVRSEGTWTSQATLSATRSREEDSFGTSVDVDGDTVVVGAVDDSGDANATASSPNSEAPSAGAAYVFVRSGVAWSQQAYLKASNAGSQDYFGAAVALSENTLVIGARGEAGDSGSTAFAPNDSANGAGAAYVFERSGNEWSEQFYLKASNAGADDQFGSSVAIDGESLLIGAPGEDGDGTSTASTPNDNVGSAGSAYAFKLGLFPGTPDIVVEHPTQNELVSGDAEFDFGEALVGSSGEPKNFTLSNAGAEELTGLSLSFAGAGAADYTVDDSEISNQGGTLSGGDAATFRVRFSPLAEGPRPATLQINSNDPDENPFIIALTGEAISPQAAVQEAYLKAGNAGTVDEFGRSVAVDGDTIVIGAYIEWGDIDSSASSPNDNAQGAGAVYVFARDGSEWVQQAYLKGSNTEANDRFGYSLALDGDTLVVGARREDGDAGSSAPSPNNHASEAGAAYIFVRDGTNWVQQAYLKASNAAEFDYFGESVAIDGDTVVVGARGEDGDVDSAALAPNDNADGAGAAYVFVRNASSWSQQAYLKTSNANAHDVIGISVAVDGDSVVVGAIGEDGDGNSTAAAPNENVRNAGAAYVFARSGSLWSQQAYLKASNPGDSDFFGHSVAIEGETVVIGVPQEDGDGSSTPAAPNDAAFNAGTAYIFERNGSDWSQQSYLKADNSGARDSFGWHVAIDEDTLVVGAIGEVDENGAASGAAYAFERGESGWIQTAYLKASNPQQGDDFGWSIAVDGDMVVVGAIDEDGDANSTEFVPNDNAWRAGAAYVFDLNRSPDGPNHLSLTPAEIAENLPPGSAVGNLSATFPDADGQFTFTLIAGEGDTDNPLFEIDGTILRTVASIDHESRPTASIRVQVEDSSGLLFEEALAVTISDDRGEDADADGLTEADEEDIYGTSDTDPDSDGDGYQDGFEVNLGTDPASPSPLPELTLERRSPEVVRITIGPGSDGLSVRLLGSGHPGDPWELIQSYPDGIAAGQSVQLDAPFAPSGQMFYKLEFDLAP